MAIDKTWIENAVKHPGLMKDQAKKAGMTVSEFEAAKHRSLKIKREVTLAKTLNTFHTGK
jgi:hypothetical protein